MGPVVIRYSKAALKFLSRLEAKTVARVRNAVHGLTADPPVGDIKVLQGYKVGTKRLRVGSLRVIYRYGTENDIEVLFILDIGNRGNIYK